MMSRVPPGVIAVATRTHPSYLACGFEAIQTKAGSIEAYLHNERSISAETLSDIRDALLE